MCSAGISATCRVVSQFIIMLHRETTLADGKPIVNGYMPGECDTLLPDINVPVIRINTVQLQRKDAEGG